MSPARPALRLRLRAAAALGLAIATIGVPTPSLAEAARASDGEWRFSLTPYVWLPTINAKIEYPLPGIGGGGGGGGGTGGGIGAAPDGSLDTEIGPNRYLTKLNFAAMLAGEARRGPWSAMADFIGLRVSGEGSRLNGVSVGGNRLPGLDASVASGSQSTLKATLWNVTGGYALVEDSAYRLDAIAGLRVGRLEANVDWTLSASVTLPDGTPVLARSGSLGASRDVVDGVIGARGRWQIDSRWAVPWYVDIGTGTSRFTWQAFAGASYAFGWGELLFAWRHLGLQDQDREVFRRVTLGGPTLGATFRF